MTSGLPQVALRALAWHRGSVAAKLYLFAILSIVAVAALAASSIYFARTTETAANRLYDQGFLGTLGAARLGVLIEQHRRLVESMPSEVDRERIDKARRELDMIKQRLTKLIGELTAENRHLSLNAPERRISASLPYLFDAGDQVVFYAREFAQDKATEKATDYGYIADGIQSIVREYRERQVQEADGAVAFMLSSANSLTIAVLICTLVAFVLIGPIGLIAMHRVLSRLGHVTHAMARLARHDVTTTVPCRDDRDEVGEIARTVEIFKGNAIALMAREEELKQLNGRIDVAFNNMTHGLCMFDARERLIVCNAAYLRMYGLSPDDARPGTALAGISDRRAALGTGVVTPPDRIATMAQGDREHSAFEQELMDGRVIAVSQRPMPDGGWVAVHEDITERQRAEARISHLAHHDLLTNLPNRVLFREFLESAIGNSAPGFECAVHCLDLDHFKTVNDTLGHPIGDQLLKLAAERLLSCVAANDMVARIGGDEFAIVQTAIASLEQCGELASRIVAAIGRPFDVDGRHIDIGTSVGIAIAPADGTDPDQLLKNADMALYLAKKDGRATHRFFEREMDRRLQGRRALELDLRSAITKGEFELHYQPVVALADGRVTGLEALIRWNHPQRGLVPPIDFISLAEETGLIVPLGEWVLRSACAHAAKWSEPISVAVNLSAAQFKGRNLVQIALGAMSSAGLSPARLDLEITESVLLQDEANTLATLHQLRGLGVRISMDDFGTGYSSLAYLRSFPFDRIKIDRSFLSDMPQRNDSRAIIRAVCELARSLKISTVIEGIETEAQREIAMKEGCDEAQGFYFSKPMPERAVEEFLAERRRMAAAA
jgi:diguanylate cyclase (GGDEF)-like protein